MSQAIQIKNTDEAFPESLPDQTVYWWNHLRETLTALIEGWRTFDGDRIETQWEYRCTTMLCVVVALPGLMLVWIGLAYEWALRVAIPVLVIAIVHKLVASA